jgi:hypothetical protein
MLKPCDGAGATPWILRSSRRAAFNWRQTRASPGAGSCSSYRLDQGRPPNTASALKEGRCNQGRSGINLFYSGIILLWTKSRLAKYNRKKWAVLACRCEFITGICLAKYNRKKWAVLACRCEFVTGIFHFINYTVAAIGLSLALNQLRQLAGHFFFWRELVLFFGWQVYSKFLTACQLPLDSIATCQLMLKCNNVVWPSLKIVTIKLTCRYRTGSGTTAEIGIVVRRFTFCFRIFRVKKYCGIPGKILKGILEEMSVLRRN